MDLHNFSTIDQVNVFADISDFLGIASPAIVEKDYYVVQLIKLLSSLISDDYRLVFSGGTCLAKAHINIYRMSEDIDIKMVLSNKIKAQSKNYQKNQRKKLSQNILALIDSSRFFNLDSKHIRNEYSYQKFTINYPQHHFSIDALRSQIKLDLTETDLVEPMTQSDIHSFYSKVMKQEAVVLSFPCVTLNEIASEKIVALLRRTAFSNRDGTTPDDETLIRHVYDLHLIFKVLKKPTLIIPLVKKVIAMDLLKFSNRHDEFLSDPIKELKHGLSLLNNNEIYTQRYFKFISPLVYHKQPATWDEAIASLNQLAKIILIE